MCLVVRYFTVGGLERVVVSLANRLAARGVDTRVVVLGTARRNALMTELDGAVDVITLSGSRRARWAALRRLTAGRVVHLHFGDGRIHPLARLALLDRPVVVTYHSVYTHQRTPARNRLDRVLTGRARAIVAVSGAVADFCVDEVGLPADRITVIPNGVATGATAAPARPAFLAVAVAGLYAHKNQRTLLAGLAQARAAGLDAGLRVVGDGPELANLHRRTIELGVRPVVDWYGAVWRRDLVAPLLEQADAFVSASRFEGMPISVLEAMGAGVPLVLSDIPAHRELAGDAALYFAPDRPRHLADQLVALAGDPALGARLAAAGRCRAGAADVDRAVTAHLAVYRAVAR